MALGLGLASLLATRADAHPYVWVVARSEIVFGTDARLTGFRHTWLFDPAYSAFAIMGLDNDRDGKPDPDKLAELAKTNVESLDEFAENMRRNGSAFGRSKVSNGTRLLTGVDGRSPIARRYRDIMNDLAAGFGGWTSLDEPERILVRQAAGLAVRAELAQAAIINGGEVSADEAIRLTAAVCRITDRLRRRAAEKPKSAPPPRLADYLAEAS